jgi:hypothetical protein
MPQATTVLNKFPTISNSGASNNNNKGAKHLPTVKKLPPAAGKDKTLDSDDVQKVNATTGKVATHVDNDDNKPKLKDNNHVIGDCDKDDSGGGSSGAAMFMAAKTIIFKAQGLKPNARYYPFFNSIDVSAYCSTTSGSQTSTIVTDNNGNVTGNFHLPANTFTTGTHIFELADSISTDGNGATVPGTNCTYVEASYEADGVLKKKQTNATDETEDIADKKPASKSFSVPSITVHYDSNTRTVNQKAADPRIYSFVAPLLTPPAPSPVTTWIKTITTTPWYNINGNTSVSAPVSGVGNIVYDYPTVVESLFTVQKQVTQLANISSPGTGYVAGATGFASISNIPTTYSFSDPIAQSFFVDAGTYPKGLFLTSIVLYFNTADASTPVTLELRNMENGTPGSRILPNGKVIVPGQAVSTSSTAGNGTAFAFDTPVYLQPNTEYCFVVKSASLGYNLWCSRTGDVDVATGNMITSQTAGGVLFKALNDTSWLPDSTEDVKFDIYAAQFDTTQTANLVFRPQKRVINAGSFIVGRTYTIAVPGNTSFTSIGAANNLAGTSFVATGVGSGTGTAYDIYYNTAQNLPLSYISTVNQSADVTIKVPSHGLIDSDTVYISYMPALTLNGINLSNLTGEFSVVVVDEDHITITANNSDTASTPGATGAVVAMVSPDALNVINPNPPVQASTNVITGASGITTGPYSPVTSPALTTPAVPSPASTSSTSSFTIYTNVPVNEVMVDYLLTQFDSSTVNEYLNVASGKSTAGSETAYESRSAIQPDTNGTFYKFTEPRLIATPVNESLHNETLSGPSVKANVQMSSADQNLSPVIDTNGMSLIVKTYKINDQLGEITTLLADDDKTLADYNDSAQNSEILSGLGSATAKYKGKIVQLDDSYSSIFLFVTGNAPSPCFIDAYVRVSNDPNTHMDLNWNWMPINGVFGTAFKNSPDSSTLTEWLYEFTLTSTTVNAGSFVVGQKYQIATVGTTDFTALGAGDNNIGTIFTATDTGTGGAGTGTANIVLGFNTFDVKLVMRSINNSIVPKIYGIRAITNK